MHATWGIPLIDRRQPQMPFLASPLRPSSRESFLNEMLVVASGSPAVDASVGPDCRAEAFVAQQLPDGFKAAGLGIEQHFRAQMTKLVCSEDDASPLRR